jgi:hypothetical protein
LGNSGEILDTKPIQNLGSTEFTGTEAQWALNIFCADWLLKNGGHN